MVEANEIHNAVSVIIISDENPPRTLLIKHKKLKSWLPPGGHQDSEMPNETAIREVREETGLDIKNYFPSTTKLDKMATSVPVPTYVLFEQIPAFKDTPAHIHQDLIYQVRVPFQEPKRAEAEHDGVAWFREDELESLRIIENARELISRAFTFFSSIQEPKK